MKYIFNCLLVFFLLYSGKVLAQVHHSLDVQLNPSDNYIHVIDSVEIPSSVSAAELHFLLHENLSISSIHGPAELEKTDMQNDAEQFGVFTHEWSLPEDVNLSHYFLKMKNNGNKRIRIVITYAGKIYHEIKQLSQEYARGFSETPGIISSEGVYLGGSSYWVPWFNEELITFNLRISLDRNWDAVSQGKRIDHKSGYVQWECNYPTEEIYLIAGPFKVYKKQVGAVAVLAYLRSPDEVLANKYLETTGQYLEMYRQLIGPYPYSKFALIENFWETGYGMPSFTLLGSKVIRFPFILHSSYPHELLHNWWGNGVYVDYSTGNWCEGMTAYLADHLIKEQRGQGAEYRRTALQAYTDYVNESNEFALSRFKSRTDAASSAIGYNKALMIFNMLRQQIGDDQFRKFLQKFYRDNKFKKAGFEDILAAVESVTGEDWTKYFDQWVNKPGAPQLKLTDATVKQEKNKFSLTFTLNQTQPGETFDLKIPIAVAVEGNKELHVQSVDLQKRNHTFSLLFDKQPRELHIDPEFDVFRTLDRNEIPPSLSHIFGTEQVLIVISANERSDLHSEYMRLAEKWSSDKTRTIKIARDDTLFDLPTGYSIWLFGLNNKFADVVKKRMSDYNAGFEGTSFQFGKTILPLTDNSVVTTVRHPEDPDETVVWMYTDIPAALAGLGRKLPHYGKYSYLAFEGSEPSNTTKGQWPAVNSPLFVSLAEHESQTDFIFPPREALASLVPVFSEEDLLQHVKFLADEKLEGRGFGSTGLWQAGDYIADKFKEIGLEPGGQDGSYFQQWQDQGGEKNEQVILRNVIGVLPGIKKDWQKQAILVCAHYDHLGRGWPDVRSGNEGKIHPGADDNASGIAVLLELARVMADKDPGRTIIFAAFTAEEAGLRGSRYYVRHMKEYSVEEIFGVLNLDTVGRLFNNKLLILGSSSAEEWKHIAMGVGFVTGIPYEIVNQDLDASDQVSFIEAGIPGLQFFSGPHSDYHRPGDTVDKIDAAGIVKVATFVKETLTYLANERDEPLTIIHREMGSVTKHSEVRSGKRAATGIMPDFAFSGPGVKVGEISDKSAAGAAGLKKGDIIISLGGTAVKDLQSYANILHQFQPGDTIELKYKRNGDISIVQVTLGSR